MRVGRVIAVGIAAGLLSGVFGVGGGILIVPGLMWVASMEQRRARGTSLAAVLPIAVFGVVTY
ncbi:MAG: TSUP family transporter, partial [Ilumatobacteraceae bacterium]